MDVRALLASAAGASSSGSTRPSVKVDREDDLTYDLGHLYAYDPSPIEEAAFASDREGYLMRTARDGAQLLTNQLYALLAGAASKRSITLPPPKTLLPREKPLPEAKAKTRWEKFAQSKGIVKKKRSKMVWDEANQQWAPRWGYGRANNYKDQVENWVIEAKPGDDPSVDPFEARAAERKMRLGKQKKQEERNRLEAAHAASVGSGGGGGGGSGSGGSVFAAKEEKKAYLKKAIAAAQTSTASVGRFDAPVAGEPSKTAGKRKRYETGVGAEAAQRDAQRTASVVNKMFDDSGRKHATVVDRTVAAKHNRLKQEGANTMRPSSKGKGGGKGKGKPGGGGAKGKSGGAKKK